MNGHRPLSLAAGVFKALRRRPALLLPFGLVALVQWLALVFFHAGPAAAVAPPVRAFWGEIYLLEPYRYLLLLYLLRPIEMAAALALNAWAVAAAASMAGEALDPRERWNSFLWHARKAAGRYFSGAVVVLAGFALARGLFVLIESGVLAAVGPASLWKGVALAAGVGFFVSLLVQGPLLFAIPALMEGDALGRALKRSVGLAAARWRSTVLIMAGPLLLGLATEALVVAAPRLMRDFFPGVALWVLLGRLSLVALAETVMAVAAALFLKFRANR